MTIIACIGSREIPKDIEEQMEALGRYIVQKGHMLVSGNARGSDQAYARGGNSVNPSYVVLMLPWKTYEASAIVAGNVLHTVYKPERAAIAARFHPTWERLSRGVKALMIRNTAIIDAAYMTDGFVILYHDTNKKTGGTLHGLRYAESLGMKCYNLFDTPIDEIIQVINNI